jgi:transposase
VDRTPEDFVKEAARIARQMRRRGDSYPSIAAQLGVDEETIKRWLKYQKPKALGPQRSKMTPRRIRFAKGLVNGKSQIQAALDAGSPTVNAARRFSYITKREPEFRDYFARLLKKAGLDEGSLADALARALHATKVAGIAVHKDDKGSKITDKLIVPDFQVQQQAARTGFELHGRLGPRAAEGEAGHAPIVLHMTVERKAAYERLIGGPLSFQVVTGDQYGQPEPGDVWAGGAPEAGGTAGAPDVPIALGDDHAVAGNPGGDQRDGGGAG